MALQSQPQSLLPQPAAQDLRAAFVGKALHDVPVPSAVLDIAKIKHNCQQMLDACRDLRLGFRAHVKTHKTVEVTRLQLGDENKDVRLIVSTVIEAECLIPLLKEYQDRGATVDMLYAVPLGASHVPRLAAVASQLGSQTLSVMIDNSTQLSSVQKFKEIAGFPANVFIKADSGYHRAGLSPQSKEMIDLVLSVARAEVDGHARFLGFYSHNSLSYNGDSPADAMDMLKMEIEVCRQASTHLDESRPRSSPLVISVGASPTALSVQNLLQTMSKGVASQTSPPSTTPSAEQLLHTLNLTLDNNFELEIHAGVYCVHDIQQVTASSRSFDSAQSAHLPIALTVLAEVTSTYPARTDTPEALVSAGTLALGREPCKDYPGWAVLTPWNMTSSSSSSSTTTTTTTTQATKPYDMNAATDPQTRIIVKRISQEHGIVGWQDTENPENQLLPLSYGQKVRVWPNHACITGAGFGWYLIVDSQAPDHGEIVQDVWPRFRGW